MCIYIYIYVVLLLMFILVTPVNYRKILGFLRIITYGYEESEWIIIDVLNMYVCTYNI